MSRHEHIQIRTRGTRAQLRDALSRLGVAAEVADEGAWLELPASLECDAESVDVRVDASALATVAPFGLRLTDHGLTVIAMDVDLQRVRAALGQRLEAALRAVVHGASLQRHQVTAHVDARGALQLRPRRR